MQLTFVLPFANAAKEARYWAFGEAGVDFCSDAHAAARCTTAFAAHEIASRLAAAGELSVCYAEAVPPEGVYIAFELGGHGQGDAYALEPQEAGRGLLIRAEGPAGALYGAYHYLKWLGWRWYAPDAQGECAPKLSGPPRFPEEPVRERPDFADGRGFYFEGPLTESEDVLLWMARNRLNLVTYRPNTHLLARKLCMRFKEGGHIFEAMLHPDRRLPDGRSLWEAHREWYGTPAPGQPALTPDTAFKVQFCVSREDLLDFVTDELLARFRAAWRHVDILDIALFNTWVHGCACEDCQALGNGSDRYMHFLGGIRKRLNDALEKGSLGRQVRLSADIYEGTDSMSPPLHALPPQLAEAGDLGVFYPILRCYAHGLNDSSCPVNRQYHAALRGWADARNSIPLTVGEYYNVSKFEDLPLLFSRTIPGDFRAYLQAGCTAVTFMHLPMCNWGVRALSYTLYAEMAWNTQADAQHIMAEYFQKRYGAQAATVRHAYDLLESAWRHSAGLRGWSPGSILSQLLLWDGKRPDQPLQTFGHFDSVDALLAELKACVRQHEEAVSLLQEAAQAFDQAMLPLPHRAVASVNPNELSKSNAAVRPATALRVDEDLRGALYGLDVLRLTMLLLAYHEALRKDELSHAEQLWADILPLTRHMRGCYAMVSPDYQRPVYMSKDALTRSQLGFVVYRILALHNERA